MTKNEELLKEIDQKAIDICSSMTTEQKEEFFAFQEQRRTSGEGYNQKYYVGRTYYKGNRKGQLRDVYNVDGCGFNQLWKLLLPFATLLVRNFFRNREIFSFEQEDEVANIMYQSFYVLRFFGPRPCNNTFSQLFPLICMNRLSTEFRRRYGTQEIRYSKKEGEELVVKGKGNLHFDKVSEEYVKKAIPADKTKINFHTVSLYNNVMVTEDDDSGFEIIDLFQSYDHTKEEIVFWSEIPDDMKQIVELLLEKRSVSEISKIVGSNYKKIKTKVSEFVTEFYQ